MLPQPWALGLPAADADVDVVALREDPGVAARDGAELDHGAPAVVLARVDMSHVPLERHAVSTPAGQPERAHRQAVDAVRTDRDGRRRRGAAEADRDRVVVHLERGRTDAVAEVGPGRRRLLGEVRVEPAPLRHQDQRAFGPALEAAAVAKAEPAAPHRVLDDWVDGNRQLPDRAVRQPAAAGLVARKALAVEQQHARARARETEGGGRSGRTGSDDDCIEALHRTIVRPQGGRSRRVRPSSR